MNIRIPFNEKNLYRVVNVFLLSCISAFIWGKYFGIQNVRMWHIGVILFSIVVVTCIEYLIKKGRTLSVLGIVGFLIILGAVIGLNQVYEFFFSYINWIGNKTQWQREWLLGYEAVQVIGLVLICFFVEVLQEKDFRLKSVGGIFLFGLLLYDMFTKQNLSKIAVVCSLCYLIHVLIEWTQRYWRKIKKSSLHAYMLWMLPFVTVYFMVVMQMPISQKPYDWQFFKDTYKKINETIYQITGNLFDGGGEYDLRLSGFSEKGQLGAGFFDREKKVMTIEGDKRLRTNVYLTGKVYADFDGNSWHAKETETDKNWYLDTVELLYAIERYDKDNLYDYLQYTDLEICYQYQKTDYLFVPIKASEIKKQGKNVDFTVKDGTLYFDKKQKYGTEFKTEFYQLNTNDKIFYAFLEAENAPDEEVLEGILATMKANTSVEITQEELETYRQACFDNYLVEIQLSEEVSDYLEEITKDADTDVEKLKAIEEELSSFTYTNNPGEMPKAVTDSSSFLDYFLLENKQGYCTYFATAFVLLARAEGIPARYVQGFCVPMDSDKEVTVTSAMSHAWPEVYLDGVGWIPFEPTPGYGKLRYTSWGIKKQDDNAIPYAEEHYRYNSTVETVIDEKSEGVNSEDMSFEQVVEQSWKKIVQTVTLTICIVLLLFFIQRICNRYRYLKMNVEQKYEIEIKRNFKILNKLGLKRDDGETLTEFGKRIQENLFMENKLCFVADYENVLYGTRTADRKMLELVTEEQGQILQILKARKRVTYFYVCLIL